MREGVKSTYTESSTGRTANHCRLSVTISQACCLSVVPRLQMLQDILGGIPGHKGDAAAEREERYQGAVVFHEHIIEQGEVIQEKQ